jgi:nucleotide-binding universal stress UspA family protein
MERHPGRLHNRFLGDPVEWILRNAPCDVVLAEDHEFDSVSEITVLTDRSPYDPSKVRIADALANEMDATVRLVYATKSSESSDLRQGIEEYHDELVALCSVPVTTEIIETDGTDQELIAIAQTASFLVMSRTHKFRHQLRSSQVDRVIDAVECPALGVYAHESDRPGLLGRLVERFVF